MRVEIVNHIEFKRNFKRLAKKYRSLPKDYEKLLNSIEENPLQGDSLGNNTYKVRMAIASKGNGKSGGARVITYAVTALTPDEYRVTLLTIYDKSEMESVRDTYIQSLISEVND